MSRRNIKSQNQQTRVIIFYFLYKIHCTVLYILTSVWTVKFWIKKKTTEIEVMPATNWWINRANIKQNIEQNKFRQKSSATPGAVEISDKTNSFKNHL